jgi:hypothetical protein
MDEEVLPHGTRIRLDQGRLAGVVDRRDHTLATLTWDDGGRAELVIPARPAAPAPAGEDRLLVSGRLHEHPVLGPAHLIEHQAAPGAPRVPVASMAAIDWARPGRIPAIDDPGELPAGTGSMVLDLTALAASFAELPALRYDGPYPTRALWRSLAQCFHPSGPEDAFPEVDLAPAPFERVWLDERIWIQLRDRLERVAIDGRDYTAPPAVRRLVPDGDDGGWAAEIWIGDARWHQVARFDVRGELVTGPDDPPALDSSVLDHDFPAPLRAALADLIADTAAPALGDSIRAVVTGTPLRWADTRLDLARAKGDAILVHAVLWDRLAPLGMERLALGLAEAIGPVARRLAQDRLAALVASS